jgi:hypothetical protein
MLSAVVGGSLAYAVVFGVPALTLAAMIVGQQLRGRSAAGSDGTEWDTDVTPDPASPSIARWVAASGLVVAGIIHLLAAPGQYRDTATFGLFCVTLGVTQLALAVALLRRPDRRTIGCVALASVWVVALWLVTRTTGLPMGPHPWEPMSYGVADVVASCTELVTAIGCFMEVWASLEQRRDWADPDVVRVDSR